MLKDKEQLKWLYITRPTLKKRWTYWFSFIFTGHVNLSDYSNTDKCFAHELKIVNLEIKLGKYKVC